eukprot:evm.model.scf_1834EXC.2 EVM.evm.TU.scf_1834EXC.2   scf_1834EXC:4953-8167(-)
MAPLGPGAAPPVALRPETGTTIMACAFDGGVVLGCDTRLTMGSYVESRGTEKMVEISDNVAILRAGTCDGTQTMCEYVNSYAQQHAILVGEKPAVRTVANIAMMMAYNNKDNLEGALIVAGWDVHEGAQVYGISYGASLVQMPWALDGSGSTYIWGECDENYREGMTRKEAEDFVANGIALAIGRDSGSGGMARITTITRDGTSRQLLKGSQLGAWPLPNSGGMLID